MINIRNNVDRTMIEFSFLIAKARKDKYDSFEKFGRFSKK